MGPGEQDGAYRPVKSAYRALDVLEAMSRGPATLAELSRMLEIPKSSLHGLMRTLTERGWVATTPEGTRFRLGLRALQAGSAFVAEDDVVGRVAPSLDRLAALTGETVQQARLDGGEVVYLAKRDSPHPVRMISEIGSRLPAHATALGKALLADRDDASVQRLLAPPYVALTPRTITTWEALAADLARTREGGYAVDDCEAADGLCCFGVVVPRSNSAPATDAISVSVPVFRLHEGRAEELATALLEEQARLVGVPSRRGP